MSRFTVTQRTRNDYFVKVPGSQVIQMSPRWIDDRTLQLAISSDAFSWEVMDAKLARRRARLKASCPGLIEALKWCASKRMGVKLETVSNVELPHDFVDELRNLHEKAPSGVATLYAALNGRVDVRGDADGNLRVVTTKTTNFGHRLVFPNVNHAFEFKLAWL